MSTEAFNETLQFITAVKLEELEKRHANFSAHLRKVLAEADGHAGGDPKEKLAILIRGMKDWPAGKWTSNINRRNMTRWLEQARRDPGFPTSILDDWTHQVEAEFKHESSRYECARLFGNLLTEWLGASKSPPDFVAVERTETVEQKQKLESIIFQEKNIDVPALDAYLMDLFSSKEAKDSLEQLRKRIKKFAEGLRTIVITSDDVKITIKSVLQSDVLSDEKRGTLKQLQENPTVLEELASVLTMKLATLNIWSWPTSGVPLEPRRQLNGKTRFFLDMEMLTCLLLHFVGVRWSTEFRLALNDFKASLAWKHAPSSMKPVDSERREAFLGIKYIPISYGIEALRRRSPDFFFMSMLPMSADDEENHYSDDTPINASNPGPLELKQYLLRILCTDVAINKAIHGGCTVVRTDLEWFGPSLPFQTILAILKFFGVPERELTFFKTFLACPIFFKGESSSAARIRKRGVPLTYMLSTLFGELSMFIMDFGVNQKAEGLFLYRLHDDFWLWDSDRQKCISAWDEMKKYADLAGLSFNVEKTGSVQIGESSTVDGLPKGDIRWGLLNMDDSGRFIIDQEMVNVHIDEMRRQLAVTTSVFGWVQAYNKYMAFIVRNCGQPSLIYGKAHIDDIINTLARTQRELFHPKSKDELVESSCSAITEVAKLLHSKFEIDTSKLPMGWYLWPNAAGGLEMKDPFADLFVMRNGYGRSPSKIIDEAFKSERREYDQAKEKWESGRELDYNRREACKKASVQLTDPFFSFEEFVKARTESYEWYRAYGQLLQEPKQRLISCTPQIVQHFNSCDAALGLFGKSQGGTLTGRDGIYFFEEDDEEGERDTEEMHDNMIWSNLSPYWQWIIGLHHNEMVTTFGSLAIVDPGSIPVGMVEVFRSARIRWEL